MRAIKIESKGTSDRGESTQRDFWLMRASAGEPPYACKRGDLACV
ncbi:hypothetical protein [uncultured Helicobacter sp.]